MRRQVTPYLATPRWTAILQSEAGTRAQSVENKQVTTLALMGRRHG
ncbi:hypothetical protein [Moorena sp. SIO4G3]|nr:hypothetical protein [Moorena sp. SIO4G3]NEO80409.1 hypothetical protein [Moorena sp. SIO4G3]